MYLNFLFSVFYFSSVDAHVAFIVSGSCSKSSAAPFYKLHRCINGT